MPARGPTPALGWGLARCGDGADGSSQRSHRFSTVQCVGSQLPFARRGGSTLEHDAGKAGEVYALGRSKNSPDPELSRAAWGHLTWKGSGDVTR